MLTSLENLQEKFAGRRILIMGIGGHGGGVGTTEFFAKLGSKIVVTDLKSRRELKSSLEKLRKYPIQYVLGRHRKQDIKWADYIVKNPAVPLGSEYLKFAKKLRKPILNDAVIFFNSVGREKIIATTGTKGKSTTVKLVAAFLKNKYKVIATGLPGTSLLQDVEKAQKQDKIIIELSSFDLDLLRISPRVAIITNIFPDHLNRYLSFKDYFNSKKNIFRFQKKNDILFLNKDDKKLKDLKKQALAEIHWFGNKNNKAFLKGMSPTSLNAALAVAKYFKISQEDIKKEIKKFKPLDGRFQVIGKAKSITFINDTASTNPGSTLFNLENFLNYHKGKTYLIIGGENKGFRNSDYKDLVEFLAKNNKKIIVALLEGSATELMKKNKNWKKLNIIIETNKMEKAAKALFGLAEKGLARRTSPVGLRPRATAEGDVILLSPAAASFNLFTDEFHRGRVFKQAFLKLKAD